VSPDTRGLIDFTSLVAEQRADKNVKILVNNLQNVDYHVKILQFCADEFR
jgi:hypothetical protein